MFYNIDTITEGCVYIKNAVRSEEDYTPEQMEKLLQGFEVPVVFDENGDPIEWEAISEEEE